MTTEDLLLRYSYGIINDWSELVDRIAEHNRSAYEKKLNSFSSRSENSPYGLFISEKK